MEILERAQRALRAMMMSRLPGVHAESEFTLSSLSVFMVAPTSLWPAPAPADGLARYLASEGVDRLRRPTDVDVRGEAPALVRGSSAAYHPGSGVPGAGATNSPDSGGWAVTFGHSLRYRLLRRSARLCQGANGPSWVSAPRQIRQAGPILNTRPG